MSLTTLQLPYCIPCNLNPFAIKLGEEYIYIYLYMSLTTLQLPYCIPCNLKYFAIKLGEEYICIYTHVTDNLAVAVLPLCGYWVSMLTAPFVFLH